MTRPRPWRTHRGAWIAYAVLAGLTGAMLLLPRDWPQ